MFTRGTQNIQKLIDLINSKTVQIEPHKLKYVKEQIIKQKTVSSIELYEFEIKGYPMSQKGKTKFGDFIDSPPGTCGTIGVKIEHNIKKEFNDNFVRSCDIITDQMGGDEVHTPQEWYDYYKKWYAKALWFDDMEAYSEKEGKKKKSIMNNIIRVTNKNKEYIKNKVKKELISKNESKFKKTGELELDENTHKDAMVFKIDVENNEQIIIFGDNHGSYHTFFRNMIRLHKMKVLDLKTYFISSGYRIIFLGDIVDRGQYGLEILTIITNLMLNNNTQDKLRIILNRGNHEENDTYEEYGFMDEYREKLKGMPSSEIKYLSTESSLKPTLSINDIAIRNLFTSCPSAIILENKSKERFWLSHGGFPLEPKLVVSGISIKSCEVYDYTGDDLIWYHEWDGMQKLETDFICIPMQIRWNDFAYDIENFGIGSRGRSIKLHNKAVEKFLKKNKIQFVIRAHQDSIANSWLLGSDQSTNRNPTNENITMNVKDTRKYIDKNNKIIFLDRTLEELVLQEHNELTKDENVDESKASMGPIARIKLDGLNWTAGQTYYNLDGTIKTVYPVLTLSTNTDLDRKLIHDSFAILRFDLSEDELGMFDADTNILDRRHEIKSFKGNKDYHIVK